MLIFNKVFYIAAMLKYYHSGTDTVPIVIWSGIVSHTLSMVINCQLSQPTPTNSKKNHKIPLHKTYKIPLHKIPLHKIPATGAGAPGAKTTKHERETI